MCARGAQERANTRPAAGAAPPACGFDELGGGGVLVFLAEPRTRQAGLEAPKAVRQAVPKAVPPHCYGPKASSNPAKSAVPTTQWPAGCVALKINEMCALNVARAGGRAAGGSGRPGLAGPGWGGDLVWAGPCSRRGRGVTYPHPLRRVRLCGAFGGAQAASSPTRVRGWSRRLPKPRHAD